MVENMQTGPTGQSNDEAEIVPGFYVMDRFATSVRSAMIAGPFSGPISADSDRRERNIAGDCEVFEFTTDSVWRHIEVPAHTVQDRASILAEPEPFKGF
jgi:hypothetical protein